MNNYSSRRGKKVVFALMTMPNFSFKVMLHGTSLNCKKSYLHCELMLKVTTCSCKTGRLSNKINKNLSFVISDINSIPLEIIKTDVLL